MFSSRAAVLALLGLAACNQLLGLEPGVDDNDGDGIADSVDNCPFDANSQQRDRDGNGLGDVCDCALSGIDDDHDDVDDACDDCVGPGATGTDVGGDGIDDGCEQCATAIGRDMDADGIDDGCDACPLGSDHDEDGDTVADACDNCPTMANLDQRETDGDAIGDVCDTAGLASKTMRFDGFGKLDPLIWSGTVPGWEWKDDGLLAKGATNRVAALRVSGPFLAETMFEKFPVPGQIWQLTASGSNTGTTCTLESTGRIALTYTAGGATRFNSGGPVSPINPVRLRVVFDEQNVSCHVIDDGGKIVGTSTIDAGVLRGRIGLGVNMGARFEYLWVVGTDP